MSEKDEKPTMPPLTAMDWQIAVQGIVGLVTWGVTLIEVHPARWPLILDAAMRYGGPFPNDPVVDEDGKVEALPIGIMLQGKPIEAVLRLFKPCSDPTCEGCPRIMGQGDNYPMPEEPSPIIVPGRGRFH